MRSMYCIACASLGGLTTLRRTGATEIDSRVGSRCAGDPGTVLGADARGAADAARRRVGVLAFRRRDPAARARATGCGREAATRRRRGRLLALQARERHLGGRALD